MRKFMDNLGFAHFWEKLKTFLYGTLDEIEESRSLKPGFSYDAENKILTLSFPADSTAEIRYTLDGSNPTASSNLYSGPFTVEPPLVVMARAYKNGLVASGLSLATVEIMKVDTPVISVVE